MARDLLLAALVRDGRTGQFHRLTGEPEPWAVARAAHLPEKKRPAAVQLGALDYLHRRQLGWLWAGLEETRRPGDFSDLQPGVDHGLLLSLNACRPFGAGYEWAGPPRSRDYICEQGRVCPWCHARKVVALHDRLVAGPCHPSRMEGRCFVRVRLRFGGDKLAYHEGFMAHLASVGSDSFTIDARLVRDYFARTYLHHRRKLWGLDGGIVTYQVDPFVDHEEHIEEPGFRHEMNLIGSVSVDRAKEIRRYNNGNPAYLEFAVGDSGGCKPRSDEPVFVELVDGDYRSAVRLLLAGSGFRFQPKPHQAWNNGDQTYAPAGVDGALRLMPWFMANPRQWWDHQWATLGTRLYETFGSWRATRRKPSAVNVRPESLAALAAYNRARAATSSEQRADLPEAARFCFQQLGGKAGYRVLRAELHAHGYYVTDRDAMRLARELKRVAE